MSKRIFLLALSVILVVALALTGCAPARRPYDNNDNNNNNVGNRTGYTGTGMDTRLGNNRGYDTGNYTGAGANPGTTGYGTGTNYRTGLGTNGNGTDTANGIGTNAGNTESDRIANAVRQIEGVQNATAVVTGNTAYVGVTLSGARVNGGSTGTIGNTGTIDNTGTIEKTGTRLNTANTNDIERRVSQIVRAIDTDTKTVYVSTENDFINRLRTVDQGVRGGSPANGFTNQLRDMVRGMQPVRQ